MSATNQNNQRHFRFSAILLIFFFLLVSNFAISAEDKEAEKKKRKSRAKDLLREAKRKKEQNQILKKEILDFVREKPDRDAGEGWLYLARHYKELREPKRSLIYLRTLFRADHIKPSVVWEAKLLHAEILEEDKDFKGALKELDRLISWNPDREVLVRAKIQRAELLGRDLTSLKTLFAAFERYYKSFPEKTDLEAVEYIMGFQRGYDLEIAMKALEAWEEISKFTEKEASAKALLQIGLLHAFDLSNPERGLPFLVKASIENTEAKIQSQLLEAVLNHFYVSKKDPEKAMRLYSAYRNETRDLYGFRISTILQSQLALNVLNDMEAAVKVLDSLMETPPHLVASESISLEVRQEKEEEERYWAILACKMAGYISEYKLNNPDRAKSYYQKASDLNKDREKPQEIPWIKAGLNRTEPKISPAQMLFEMAYEKYRSRKIHEALKLYERFIQRHPNHELYREALFRSAVITDDDVRDFDTAYEMYQRYLIKFSPVKSSWNLDVLYDWSRIDEVRYRMGNLLVLHRKDPVGALEIFKDLAYAYPDSYWAMQGQKDSIRIVREDLGDDNRANEMMIDFIGKYPESEDSAEYRLKLYKTYIQKNEQVKALHILRNYLDHRLPSEKDYFKLKQQWRDLAFRIREESLRKILDVVGNRDKVEVYENLMDVLTLASSSAPLKGLIEEVKELKIDDELRWGLVYKGGVKLYREYPEDAKELFEELASTSTGTPQLKCVLTLGNIAYRVKKDVSESVKWYEKAMALAKPLNPYLETPQYRLGRLYLAEGRGIKGLETLQRFCARFPRSRHLPKAYLALGEASAALHHPVQATRFFRRVMRISPNLAEKAGKRIAELKEAISPEEWLRQTALERNEERELIQEKEEAKKADENALDEENSKKNLANESAEELYEELLIEVSKSKPDIEKAATMALEILTKDQVSLKLRQKALKRYISCRFFRKLVPELFVNEAQMLLSKHNYAEWQSELLYRLAMAKEHFQKEYEEASKSYFEYLSFYPNGIREIEVRKRIPRVYTKLEDVKNAERFFRKLIDDSKLEDEVRVNASIDLAKLLISEDKKKEAIRTLEASLAYESERKGEICLRLERLTEQFSYVQQALEFKGLEEFRLKALKRVIKKAEEDQDYIQAGKLLEKYSTEFETPDATVWVEKKLEELGKRGVISDIETLIEQYPEEPETAARMFRLAKLVEGAENTKYRSQDLFYEITLVYPKSDYFRESKIRADKTRSIKAVSELSDMLRKGTKGREGQEVVIERARLLKEDLKDLSGAMENYETFVKLFPDSERLDEVYLGMGDIVLSEEKNHQKAVMLWEKGLSASRDPFLREELTQRISDSKTFRKLVLYSEKSEDIDKGLKQIFKIWKLQKDPVYAIGLLREAVAKLENRPNVAKLRYYIGRILEDAGQLDNAYNEYDLSLRSIFHPGCRKDMLLYRMARIRAAQGKEKEAYELYRGLVHRYPLSLLSRSGFYWLYKYQNRQKNLTRSHHYLTRLLNFRNLYPTHRQAFLELEKDLESRMNIEEMARLRKYSETGGSDFPYFIGKVLENDLRDYDRAIKQYEKFLQTSPSIRRSREIMTKIANLYEEKGDFVKAVGYLDMLLDTYQPQPQNFDLIFRIGNLVEDKIGNPELSNLFYSSIVADYARVPKVRRYAEAKLKRFEEKRREAASKPRTKRKIKRVYTEDDEAVIEELEAIIERQIDDLQDFKKAEREMIDLWDENQESLATLDIMKSLVELNLSQLMDPQKAAEFYERWLQENPDDPLVTEYTLKLYDHYMEVLRDGEKALRLLENFIREHPVSVDTIAMELKLAKANEILIRNFDEARRIYQRIIDTKQNDPIVHEAYFRMGFVLRDGYAYYEEAVKLWQELIDLYYQNEFADKAQFAIGFTYETYQRDYTKARQAYEKILNLFPNSTLQNQARDALLRIEGK